MRKLLKYEMRALNRRLFPLYAGVLAMAVLNYFFGIRSIVVTVAKDQPLDGFLYTNEYVRLLYGVFQTCIIALFFGLIVAMFVIWLLTVINRFRKGLLGEEGYLMFTLPVSTDRLIGAKMLGASIHLLLASVVSCLAICIMIGVPDICRLFFGVRWGEVFAELNRAMPSWPLVIVEMIVIGVVTTFASVLQFYLAMALGHLSNSHRTLLSVLAYIGIAIALNMISGMLMIPLSIDNFSDFLWQIASQNIRASVHIFMLIVFVFSLIECVVMWFGTRYILKNKLNLE